ncbi:protein SODIUM POTASSIUM ROOT DEFECTIVE 2 isoform X2 [Pyrus x bretschneideri]|nr:protein SODIUM POTASSIUM ROOT DEFECTIVE 2 isoform X2 [Pyrus x bretschneideri]
MKKKMMMKGFMCQSQAATAVCMSDARSVIVPPPTRPAAATSVRHNHSAGHVNYMMMRRSTSTNNGGGGGHYYDSRLLDTTPPAHGHETSHYHSRRRSAGSTSSILNHQDQRPMSKSTRKLPSSDPDLLPPSSSADNVFQVVVMRVSIHCHGCAGKLKKHLSKMEGVTSFSIDLETKMVTVRGHVSPVGVVESISKVKKAELLTG